MNRVIEYIIDGVVKNENEIRTIKRVIVKNNKAARNSLIIMELAILTLGINVYYNSLKIEKLEKEIKELKEPKGE